MYSLINNKKIEVPIGLFIQYSNIVLYMFFNSNYVIESIPYVIGHIPITHGTSNVYMYYIVLLNNKSYETHINYLIM